MQKRRFTSRRPETPKKYCDESGGVVGYNKLTVVAISVAFRGCYKGDG